MYFHLIVWRLIKLGYYFLKKNPEKRKLAAVLAISGVTAGGGLLYAADKGLKYRATISLLHPVMEKLEKGTLYH